MLSIMMSSLKFTFKFVIIQIVIKIVVGNDLEKICTTNDNCESCLDAHFNCTWCTDKDYNILTRCSSSEFLISNNCPKENIIKNEDKIEIIENLKTQDYQLFDEKSGARAIQLQPQKLKMKLVKDQPQRFKMTYRPAENYPLDLYYLMDLTWSMRDDKDTLLKIGEELAVALKTLTENYRLGFGSFADKPAMPMIMPGAEKNPCVIEHVECEPTYGFRHHLAMTNNIKDFVRKVNASQVTGNLDNLEGGLDALMQVIVCTDKIGWSNSARKIVVLVTDGFMHFAGDGLLAGVVTRNDKKCHLNEYGEYDGTLIYDYPSLEEIYRELTKRKINVIFAVTESVAPDYYKIGDLMKEISSVEILHLDSSNILELIKKGHQTLIKKVQFEDTSPSIISVSYETNCGKTHKNLVKNFCNNINIGQEIDFYVNVTLNDFPRNEVYNHIIRIEESGLSEFVEIEVELQRPCPCTESIDKSLEARKLCNEHGNFYCGMCSCDEGWLGTVCSCDSGNYTTNRALQNQCRFPLSSSDHLSELCSNHGDCDCGKCYCSDGYNGKYCECDDCSTQCDSEREECYCGKCICKYGWSGERCNCRETNETCESPNGSICSNQGQCKCGSCICDEQYSGTFCEINSETGNMLCDYYTPCVECLITQRKKSSTENCNNNMEDICSNKNKQTFIYDFTNEIIDSNSKCLLRLTQNDNIKCDHYFSYHINIFGTSRLKINMNSCSPLNVSQFALYTFFITLLCGIVTLIVFKIFFYFKDKREYANFEAEWKRTMILNRREGGNPIYRNPNVHYSIPKLDEY